MVIGVDKAQKSGKHIAKHEWLEQHGHKLVFLPVPTGDYIIITPDTQETIDRRGSKLKKMDLLADIRTAGVTIDTKQNLSEVYTNLIGRSHERFKDEAILAQKNSIRFVVLIEHGYGINSLEDVKQWKNPRIKEYCQKYGISTTGDFDAEIADFVSHGGIKPPVSSAQLAKTMQTMAEKYGIEWRFCNKWETGRRIVEILGGER
jgi:hypothetical protein